MTTKIKNNLFLIFLILLVSCNTNVSKKIEEERFLFGTNIKIVIYSENVNESKKLINETYVLMEEIEKKYNSRNENSIIYKVNKTPLTKQKIDSEFYDLIKKAIEVSEFTKGSFDITVGPLMNLWGFDDLNITSVPTKEQIEESLNLVNFKDINLSNDFISLAKENQRIDTGAFLKGYAINKGIKYLRNNGVTSAMITAVSSIETIGSKPEKKPFKIGVQNPENPQNLLYTIELFDKALGVSGDYQTYVEINGKKYHHILNAKTGYPSEYNSMVLVLGENSFDCDLLSTAFFTMEAKDILFYVNSREDLETFIVDKNGKEYFSKNIKKYLKK